MTFESCTRYKIISKINCPVKLLFALLARKNHSEKEDSLNASLLQEMPTSFGNWKAYSDPGASDSNLKNLQCMPL